MIHQSPEGRCQAAHQGHKRLLLAEDDDDVRWTTLRMLERLGYQVQAFASGTELLATLRWQDYPADLLVTDFEMPGLSGYELASHLRWSRPQLKILLTSGLPETTIMPAIKPVDWPSFISKPFTMRSLDDKLRELLHEQPREPGG
jgi:CheY-like chemotaxis protein